MGQISLNLMYYLYVLKCADGTLYAGITGHLARRIREYNSSPRRAKYTAARRPVRLVFSRAFRRHSAAARAEARIKKLSRARKLAILKK